MCVQSVATIGSLRSCELQNSGAYGTSSHGLPYTRPDHFFALLVKRQMPSSRICTFRIFIRQEKASPPAPLCPSLWGPLRCLRSIVHPRRNAKKTMGRRCAPYTYVIFVTQDAKRRGTESILFAIISNSTLLVRTYVVSCVSPPRVLPQHTLRYKYILRCVCCS